MHRHRKYKPRRSIWELGDRYIIKVGISPALCWSMKTKQNNVNLPAYSTAAQIQREIVAVSRKTLREWARRGWVSSAKLGDTQQAGRLYRTADVMALIESVAAGRAPRQHERSKRSQT